MKNNKGIGVWRNTSRGTGYVNYQNEQIEFWWNYLYMIKNRSKNPREWKTALVQPIYKEMGNQRDLGKRQRNCITTHFGVNIFQNSNM